MARLVACLSLIALAFGCGGSDLVLPTDPGAPAAITMVQGDDQTGAPGTALTDSIVVKVTDSAGNPVPNQQVVFTLASAAPGAAVSPQSATTGPDGTASARWILGQATDTQEVVAQVIGQSLSANLTVRFTASATTDEPPSPPPGSNQPPVAADDEYNSIEGYENTLTVGAGAGVLQNDSDPEGGGLTASSPSDPPHGRVSLDADGSFSYNPEPSFFGDDQFTYRVEDEQGEASTATVTIHVAPINDSPRFTGGPDIKVKAGAGSVRISGWARSISPGADNESDQILTFEVSNDNPGLFASGGQPAVTREGPQSRRGTLIFTTSGETGTARVTVVLRDNGGRPDTSDPRTPLQSVSNGEVRVA